MKTRNLILIGALVIQSLTASTQALQPEVLYEFQQGQRFPNGLILGRDGSLYGTTHFGGSQDIGTVFKLDTNRVFTSLASFTGTIYEANPGWYIGLIADEVGNFYGATDAGNLFKVSPDGQLTTLVSFRDTNRAERLSSLAMGSDHALYGTTYFGDQVGIWGGTAFRLTTDGDLTTLVTFNGTNGAVPNALALGSDGNLYGTTAGEAWDGISQGAGTVFRLTMNGDLTTLSSYTWTNWSALWPKLTLGKEGNFYGTTTGNGDGSDNGSIFRLTANGALTTLVSFNGTNGANSWLAQPLVLGSDGNFYGTTENGGVSNFGTLFKMTPGGELSTLVSFNGTNGAYPRTPLVFRNDGNLYGTTIQGGSGGGGTIFRLVLPKLRTPARELDGSFLLTGTGPANDSYRLWASTDLSLPFASWTLLTSGSFDSTGNFSFTDKATNHSRFYQLSVP